MAVKTVGCVRPSFLAPAWKPPCETTASKHRSCCRVRPSMVPPLYSLCLNIVLFYNNIPPSLRPPLAHEVPYASRAPDDSAAARRRPATAGGIDHAPWLRAVLRHARFQPVRDQ